MANQKRLLDHPTTVEMATDSEGIKPSQLDVIKEYPPRGALQQFRLGKVATFTCDRCSQQKTAKLVATKHGDWGTFVCNGCYGWLLSRSAQELSQSSMPRPGAVAGGGSGDRSRNKGGVKKRKGRPAKKHRLVLGDGDN